MVRKRSATPENPTAEPNAVEQASTTINGREQKLTPPDKLPTARDESEVPHDTIRRRLPYEGDIPALPDNYQAIVTSTFTIPEPKELYAEIEASILPIKASKASMGELLDALDHAQNNARLARQLYVNTKATVEAVELDTGIVISAMRDAVTGVLEAEKAAGTRKKTITEADVAGLAATTYPDEWREAHGRISKAKLTLSYIDNLCERTAERARDLRAIVTAARNVG